MILSMKGASLTWVKNEVVSSTASETDEATALNASDTPSTASSATSGEVSNGNNHNPGLSMDSDIYGQLSIFVAI